MNKLTFLLIWLQKMKKCKFIRYFVEIKNYIYPGKPNIF
jgi:hypothetical protein